MSRMSGMWMSMRMTFRIGRRGSTISLNWFFVRDLEPQNPN